MAENDNTHLTEDLADLGTSDKVALLAENFAGRVVAESRVGEAEVHVAGYGEWAVSLRRGEVRQLSIAEAISPDREIQQL